MLWWELSASEAALSGAGDWAEALTSKPTPMPDCRLLRPRAEQNNC